MAMSNPTYFRSAPLRKDIELRELNFHLYLRQLYEASSEGNEKTVVSSGHATRFGHIWADDWTMYDGTGSDANLVARAQGVHSQCDMSQLHSYFVRVNIEFVDKRFKGSSLTVVGNYKTNKGEWAVVGGTGEFGFAQGVATWKVREEIDEGNIREFRIHCVTLSFPKPTKEGLFGGPGGKSFDASVVPRRIESITINSDDVINSIGYSYIDEDGENKKAGELRSSGHENKIVFAPTETIEKIVGTTGVYNGYTIVTSLSIITDVQPYGPFGKALGNSFSAPAKDTDKIVGIFGRTGQWLDAIGFYVCSI